MKNEKFIEKIAKRIIASPTIYNTPPYRINVYPDEAEGNHKERHISVQVQKDRETGTISIKDGELLAGNLSSKTMKWCLNEFLTDENKKRIIIMIENNDFYRLDRPIEVKAHPLSDDKTITAFKTEPSWEDMLIENIEYLHDYIIRFKFQNGKIKDIDILSYIKKHEKIFKPMIENKNLVKKVKLEPMGTGIYWNDIMGIESETLYNLK